VILPIYRKAQTHNFYSYFSVFFLSLPSIQVWMVKKTFSQISHAWTPSNNRNIFIKGELKILFCFRFRAINTADSFSLCGENKQKKRKKTVIPILELIRLDAYTFCVTMPASLLCIACLLLLWASPFITPPFSEQLRLERGTSIYLLRLCFVLRMIF
jgi:hypothetical protein